jgi:hypothetical protein
LRKQTRQQQQLRLQWECDHERLLYKQSLIKLSDKWIEYPTPKPKLNVHMLVGVPNSDCVEAGTARTDELAQKNQSMRRESEEQKEAIKGRMQVLKKVRGMTRHGVVLHCVALRDGVGVATETLELRLV